MAVAVVRVAVVAATICGSRVADDVGGHCAGDGVPWRATRAGVRARGGRRQCYGYRCPAPVRDERERERKKERGLI
ncbi:hypothetical protein EDB85DRAFT_1934337 [Lactarius pseudohatsudake]|nr:hypothetical protein EDB85DRAFT_1934337 [Lactarius pseudohatsudake]